MKRLLITILCFSLCSTLWAAEPVQLAMTTVSGRPAPGASAACSKPTENTTGSSYFNIGKVSENQLGWGGSFTSSTSYTLKSFVVTLKKVESPNLTITAKICTDSSGKPSNTCTTADATLATTSLTTSDADYRFVIAAGYAITAARFHVGLTLNALEDDDLNWVAVKYNNTGTEIQTYTADGSAYSNLDTSSTSVLTTSTCVDQ